MNLGETIYKYRISKNLSQGDLAEMLDVSRQSISKWENNSATPDLDKIVKLCEIFGISIDELVKGEESTAGSQSSVSEQAVDSEQAPYQTDMHVAPQTGFSGRKIAGTILLCMAFLIILFLTMMGSFAGGLLLTIPFVVCAAICFIFKHNVGLWCSWAVYFLIDMYLRVATGGANRNSIFNIIFYRESGPTFTWYMISGWVLFLTLGLLTAITILRFKNKPLEITRKTRNLLIAGTVTAVVIKILQIILPTTAYYSYVLAHLISLSVVHSILYALVDWIKVGIVVALMVAFARYRFKPTVIISVSIIVLSTIINFAANASVSNKITQNNEGNNSPVITGPASYGKSIYEHGLDIVSMLEEITNSEEYVQAFSGSEEILNVIKGLRNSQ